MGKKQGLKFQRLLFAAALATGIGCGHPDVEERLRCTLSADGTAEVAFEVTFPDLAEDSAAEVDEARTERIAELRRYYFEGWDPWAARFERAGQAGETLSWERIDGSLRALTRTARLAGPDALASFFADTDLTVLFSPGPEECEVAVFAGSSRLSSRFSRSRRRATSRASVWNNSPAWCTTPSRPAFRSR